MRHLAQCMSSFGLPFCLYHAYVHIYFPHCFITQWPCIHFLAQFTHVFCCIHKGFPVKIVYPLSSLTIRSFYLLYKRIYWTILSFWLFSVFQNGEEVATCPSCSLVIKVIYNPEDFAEDEEKPLKPKDTNTTAAIEA